MYTYAAGQIAVATKFATVAPNLCRFSVLNVLLVTSLAPRILKWLQAKAN